MSKKGIEAIYALSPVQEGMLFHSLYAPDSGVYVGQLTCTIEGALDLAVLEQAWQQMIDRHPILRTAFAWERLEKPLQVVKQRVQLPIISHDWSALSSTEQATRLRDLLHADQTTGFNLSQAPLMRLTLIRLAADRYHFIWSRHHLLLDGWSTSLILKELFTSYAAISYGQRLEIPPSRPYRDYIAWLKRQDLTAAEAFWRTTLGDFTTPTSIGVDKVIPGEDGESIDRQLELTLSPTATAALQAFARRHELTLNTLFQGAWALMLSRYSGQEDVVFGATVSGRPADLNGVESITGLFINTLPVRVQATADTQLVPWLSQLQEHQAELRQYEYSSLVEVQSWSGVPQPLPLFESILVFENYPFDPAPPDHGSSLRIRDVQSSLQTNFPLTILAIPGTGLTIQIKFDPQRFTSTTIRHMLAQFASLLEQFPSAAQRPLRSFSLVTATARDIVPDPAVILPEPEYTLVPEMIAAWARQSPEQIAISQGAQSWSYDQLGAGAQAIARTLAAHGLDRGDTVALVGPRSFGLIAGMIGVLAAGGVMLPIDRNLPAQRQRLMLAAAQTKYVIYLGAWQDTDSWLRDETTVQMIQVDADSGQIDMPHAREDQPLTLSAPGPDDAAYIFFTSGTTGQPKGILGCHKGLAHFLTWQRETFAVGPHDRAAQLINLSFDVVLRDIFLPLVSGATLCLPDDPAILAADRIFEWLEREHITLMHTVPALVQSWLAAPTISATLATLRYAFFAGEPLTDKLVNQWHEQFPQAGTIVNLYGPTETTLAKCFYIVPKQPGSGVQPVGRTLPQTQALVLNADGAQCGIGEPGEIVIRTPFRSLGYINVPREQQQQFVANHFRDDARDLLYRTGDRGRYRANGLLEILGRQDHQVKIRGVRVEPDEVTAILTQQPLVKSGIVVAQQDEQSQNMLVAYVVAERQDQEFLADLHANMSQRLPSAMVPSAFVFLDQLPLTPNGKVDRRKLPAADLTQNAVVEEFVPPQTEEEELMAGLWQQVLGVRAVSRHANFFTLGGHSLRATQLIARLRDRFQIDLPLRALFETPTLAAFTAAVAVAQRAARGQALPPLLPTAHDQPVPLAFPQQRLWFLEQLAPGLATYHIPSALRIDGQLDPAALQASLTALVVRQAALRTSFVLTGDQPYQRLAAPQDLVVPLPLTDLSALPATAQDAQLQDAMRHAAQQPFDLAHDLLLRAQLLRLAPDRHVLLLTVHHIASDAWSQALLVRELATLYRTAVQGGDLARALPALPIQYADFAVWQRAWMTGVVLDQLRHYWTTQLAAPRAVLDLPSDRPRPAQLSGAGARVRHLLSPEVRQALHALSQQEHSTLFMTVLAALQTVLARYTGQTDILVGTPIANRTQSALEGVIGCFVNTLVLRGDLSGQPTFRDVVQRARAVCLAAYAHQDLPFEQVVEAVQPERDLSRSPLFQVMLVLQNIPTTAFELPDVTLQSLDTNAETSKFDLTLIVHDSEQGLSVLAEYSTDLFDGATIARLLEHLAVVLTAGSALPDQPIATLPLLTAAERQALLVDANATAQSFPDRATLLTLLAAQVARTPRATALVTATDRLSYADVDVRANQLAHRLQAQGVGPETLVAICLSRSVDMVVGLLGILKAGAAYVPLDPEYPKERLAFMLQDSQARVIVTQQQLLDQLPDHQGPVICLDRDWATIEQYPATPPGSNIQPDNLAYIIYTSGSTGKPKGVAITHDGLSNYLQWAVDTYAVAQGRGGPVHSPLGFDLTVTSLFTPLLCGRSVWLLPQTDHVEALADGLNAHADYSLVKVTPAHLDLLRHMLPPESVAAQTRAFVIGGEALRYDTIAFWRTHAPTTRLINEYGPTETVVGCCIYEVGPGDAAEGTVPIGRPIANMQMYILDPQGQPVPIGVPGEIYIGGAQLGRGYLGRPELTAERFVPHPFSDKPGARVYRTGDLARYLPDGTIDYLGRIDHQVKLRGFRIELGEIEAVLMQHPAVREAVTLVSENSSGDQRLAAYVVATHDHRPAVDDLRSFLAEHLPTYMVPSAFVFLDQLPLTTNGKVDRRALPALDEIDATMGEDYSAPQTEDEELMAGLWQQVLGVRAVSRHANFFTLGGHSLRATQLIARLRDRFQIDLPLRALFETPTLAAFTAAVAIAQRAARGQALPPLLPTAHDQPLPLAFPQQRLWFLEQLAPGLATYHIPSALRIDGQLDPAALQASLTALVVRQAALRTTFVLTGDQPYQRLAAPQDLVVPLPITDLRALPEAAQEIQLQDAMRHAAQQPFDLAHDLLLRAQLLRLAPDRHVLLLTVHHIASDAWSQALLVRELATLYRAAIQHGDLSRALPALPVQYADFAVWQRSWMTGAVLDQLRAYWTTQLAAPRAVLDLPSDRPRPAQLSGAGARVRHLLSPEVRQALHVLSQQEHSTLFMTVLAALQTVLARYTGQTDILVGTPIANRTQSALEGVIGCFVNTLVLRGDLSGQPTFRDVVQRARAVCLAAYAHQDLPFEQVVEAVQPERDLSRSPLFQVMLVLQNIPTTAFELPDLTLMPLQTDAGGARFDLTIFFAESEQGLSVMAEYSTDLFDEATIARLLEHLAVVLTAGSATPDQPIATLPLLTAAERQALLVDANATTQPFPDRATLLTLLADQVARTPRATALVTATDRLSYAELDVRANQLAHVLQAQGVGPETLVAICLSRGVDMVVGLLGILKAGAAYVPLDPEYPKERLEFILADTEAPVLITERSLVPRLPAYNATILCLDEMEATLAASGNVQPQSSVNAANLAYIIYTSGSTGKPKGVAITHQSAVALCAWATTIFTPEDLAGVLAATSICFDLSVFELFVTLTNGGAVILAANAVELAQLPTAAEVTLINTVPSAMTELIRLRGVPATVRTVALAGEPLPNALVQQIYQQTAVQKVFNLYGPSEDTTYSTFALAPRGADVPPPIGRPLANTQAYLLDAQMQPVPVGVPGEIYLSGIGLARGYLNRPDLTAERFIPNPFATETTGTRLYKTGDLARYLPDGTIDYLGRIDHQVKLRGFRIELGEIEAALRQHPGVSEIVVLVREDAAGDKALVAYLVPDQIQPPTPDDLRSFLKDRLPGYMIPTAFVMLEALPLTPNGKIDRKALASHQFTRAVLEVEFVAPRTPEEATLATIWSDVLHLEQVGINDNFFDLGGHSLVAIQAIARMRDAFEIDIPLRQLFETPTIAELAEAISELRFGNTTTDSSTPGPDLSAEVVLDPAIRPEALTYTPVVEPRAILLTGATGFLGVYLLHELLQQTRADIYCLVRASDAQVAYQRIQDNLQAHLLWNPDMGSRIIPIVGDLTQPYCGLAPEDFNRLAETIDVIYHNGASVNLAYSYDMVKAANVLSTQEILRLASQTRLKPVHFISTISVFSRASYAGVVYEDDLLEHEAKLAGGYAQSKWVAEKLVMLARAKGLPCSIYRPGRIGWHSQTGVWNRNDALYKVIKGCIQLGSVPELERTIEVAPVDYVSKAIVTLAQQPSSLNKGFHLVNQQPVAWSAIVQWMITSGYTVRQLPVAEWSAELLSNGTQMTDNVLYPLLALADQRANTDLPTASSHLHFDDTNTTRGLSDTEVACPVIDDALLRAFFAYFGRSEDLSAEDSADSPRVVEE